MEQDVEEQDPDISIVFFIHKGEPVAELVLNIEEMTNPEQLAADFIKLYTHLDSDKIRSEVKKQLKEVCNSTENASLYTLVKEKLQVNSAKKLEKSQGPAISPLDVFRRIK